MELSNNTVFITGGASGIGLALATRFLKAGSQVVVCGRRKDVLDEAAKSHPGLQTFQCDVANEKARLEIFEQVTKNFPDLNVLVNNAGIQQRPPSLKKPQNWSAHAQEIAINMAGAMHLSMLFTPVLMKRPVAAIINITSGLAFVPIASMPTYCATKAAMHSFTMSLRWQLKDTSVKVFEVAPPGVNTDLGGKGLHDWGVPVDEFADFAMSQIAKDVDEFGYQFSANGMNAGADERKKMFERMNAGQG